MQRVALRDRSDGVRKHRTQLTHAIGREVGTHRLLTQASEQEGRGIACELSPQLSPLHGHVLDIVSACQEHEQAQATALASQKACQEERRGIGHVGIIEDNEARC